MRNDFQRRLDHADCNRAPTDKLQKLRDGGGLYLYIEPTGRRGWRFYYQRPVTKKQNTISFGVFPEVGLADARIKCDAARALVAKGVDPSTNKQEVARATVEQTAGAVTFLDFTNFAEGRPIGPWWQVKMMNEKSRVSNGAKCADTVRRVKIELATLQAALGQRPLKEIKSREITALLDTISAKGNHNKAVRVQQLASRIFDLAVARDLCEYNVAAPCKEAIAAHVAKKRPAITDSVRDIGLNESEALVGELMRDIREFGGRAFTAKALEMMALTFPRPANIVTMAWADIKGDTWVISAEQMKMRRVHKVPLSRQALAILEQLKPITGQGKYVFALPGKKPMTKNCLTRALARMGYDTENEHCTHGFRSMASTLLNESGKWNADAIELQLAHKVGGRDRGGRVAAIYNQAERMDERKAMLAWWGDHLDRLAGGNVVQLTAKAA